MSPYRLPLTRCGTAVLLAGMAAAAGFAVCAPLLPVGSLALRLVDHVLLMIGGAVVVNCCWRVPRQVEGRDRWAWTALAASLTCWSAGTLDYTLRDLLVEPSQVGTLDGEVCYLLAVVLAFVGFGLFRREVALLPGWARRTLDALTVVSGAAFVVWDVGLRVVLNSHVSEPAWWTAVLYPIGDLVLVSVAVLTAAGAPPRRRVSLSLLACAMAAFAVSDTGAATLRSLGLYHDGTLTDVGWIAGCFLGAAAAACYSDEVRGESSRRVLRARAWRAAFLPYALVVPAAAVAVSDAVQRRPPDAGALLLGGIVLLFVVLRQVFTIVENMRLVEQLTGRETELRHQACSDALTGLANRRVFRERLEEALRRQPADEVAVLFIDIDDFKVVNDTLGHRTGDDLLAKIGNRLVACVREGDLPARLGGDEFAVLIPAGGLTAARAVATRLTRMMRQPVVCGQVPVFVQASLGIAVGSDATERTSQQLLEQADMAMYAAKDAGKARAAVYQPAMRERLLDQAAVRDDLARALGRGQLSLNYQPIVDLASGRMVAAEALLRWRHPDRGAVPPSVFIPLAEQTGLIAPLGRWVLEEACREAAEWQRLAPSVGCAVSVNLSAGQLVGDDLAEAVGAVLDDTGLPARLLTLEITESVLMADDEALAQLARLKQLGVRLAIDDFGTGYSGLSYLDRLPVDSLKVDKAFVQRLEDPSSRAPLAEAVIGLGELLSLDVIAEGVETPGQLAALLALGCRQGQGYYFSRPVPAEALRGLLTGPSGLGVTVAGQRRREYAARPLRPLDA